MSSAFCSGLESAGPESASARAAALPCGALRAQDYPSRPITTVVPFPPGGAGDILSRILGKHLEQRLGKPFVVENKGGAGGNIGMGQVARADPDGYTILLSTSAYSVNPGLYPTLPYDPFKDFAAVCELAARWPLADVPLFRARIGLRLATRRASRPKRRGLPNDST